MQVRDLKAALDKLDESAHICALVYTKDSFDYPEDDEVILTDAGWEKVCNEFDEIPFNDIWESISMAVLDYAEERE